MTRKININILSWNVRGMNDRDKRLSVRQSVLVEKPDFVTFQETKLRSINTTMLREMCGRRLDQYLELPAQGTRGGVLLAWCQHKYTLLSSDIREYTVTAAFQNRSDATKLTFTAVYGPTTQRQRCHFFNELRAVRPPVTIPWVVGGDINVTAASEDRNINGNTWRSTLSFAGLVNELGLINLQLSGRSYTWSNDRQAPHFARLDRFLISTEWNAQFPNSAQRALPNTSSDHCPLLLSSKTGFKRSTFFRFENMWLRFQQFLDVVKAAWESAPVATTPAQLHSKLINLQHQIKAWSKGQIGVIKCNLMACRDFLSWIDKIKEQRMATQLEKWVATVIKRRHTTLAELEEDLWRQRARTRWEIHGDRNTKYFHATASNRKRANMITQIEHDGILHSDHNTKAKVFFEYFLKLMGTPSSQMPAVHWQNLYPTPYSLPEMSATITAKEIHDAIVQWPNNKSSGPDGFSGEFYKFFASMLVPDLEGVFKRIMET